VTSLRIAIPTLDGRIEEACLLGLLGAWSRFPCAFHTVRGSRLPASRDRICAEFLEGDDTHLLCLDADMSWTAEDVARLLALGTDFAFGYYAGKAQGAPLMCSPSLGRVRVGDVEAHEHAACGAGFVLLSRSCVERLTEAHRADTYRDTSGRMLVALWQTPGVVRRDDGTLVAEGEDFAFCRRWRALGGRIYGHPGVVLGHVGQAVYRPQASEARE
jgi:hypothetical protein